MIPTSKISMFAVCGIDEERFRELFRKHRTVREVARILGVSRRTVSKYRKEMDIAVVAHRPKTEPGVLSFKSDFSRTARWLREHPDEVLPRSIHEAEELTGIPAREIEYYLERRARRIRAWALSLGDVRTTHRTIVSEDGKRVPTLYIRDYRLTVHVHDMSITLRASLTPTIEMRFNFTPASYAALFSGEE